MTSFPPPRDRLDHLIRRHAEGETVLSDLRSLRDELAGLDAAPLEAAERLRAEFAMAALSVGNLGKDLPDGIAEAAARCALRPVGRDALDALRRDAEAHTAGLRDAAARLDELRNAVEQEEARAEALDLLESLLEALVPYPGDRT